MFKPFYEFSFFVKVAQLFCLALVLFHISFAQIPIRNKPRIYSAEEFKEISRKTKELNELIIKKDYRAVIDSLDKEIIEAKNDSEKLLMTYFTLAQFQIILGQSEKAIENIEKSVNLGFGQRREEYSLFVLKGINYDFTTREYEKEWNAKVKTSKWEKLIGLINKNFVNGVQLNGDNPAVQLIFEADQADRNPKISIPPVFPPKDVQINWDLVSKRDLARQKKMRKLAITGKIKSVNDFRSAAFVFQHSPDVEGIEMAKKLAQLGYNKAVNPNEKCSLGWILAASTDRLLWWEGKPQIYGTQSRPYDSPFVPVSKTKKKRNDKSSKTESTTLPTDQIKWTLDPIDLTIVTNSTEQNYVCPSWNNL